jgi:hypothetical protein
MYGVYLKVYYLTIYLIKSNSRLSSVDRKKTHIDQFSCFKH